MHTEEQILFDQEVPNLGRVVIRYPTIDDVNELRNYINVLSKELSYIYYQGEQVSLEEEKAYLQSILKRIEESQMVYLMALVNGKLAGSAQLEMKELAQNHIGTFAISLGLSFRGKGLGRILMDCVLEQSKTKLTSLTKCVLSVYANNEIAIQMYKKFGFKVYGTLENAVQYRGGLVDELYMFKDL